MCLLPRCHIKQNFKKMPGEGRIEKERWDRREKERPRQRQTDRKRQRQTDRQRQRLRQRDVKR